ncbi:snRNA-activating protein of 50kDa MW C terminal-domain-containing protein [Boletus edulis]|nr:snRNA-activating protein of 50kDa MW C terminal-domain-containing protein [Boletus edulis]
MSVDITRGYDSFFGPPSEPISVQNFLDDTASLTFPSASDVLNHASWQNLSEDERVVVEAECSGSIAELKAAVEELWDNPMLSAHLNRAHATAVNAVHCQAGGPVPKGRKRKHLPDPETAEAQPEVRALQEKLDAISLQCWRLNQESAFFMRAAKHSDLNALRHVKKSGHGTLVCNKLSSPSPRFTGTSALNKSAPHRDALVTLTVHNRVPWIHSQLTRFSQHVVLSSQSLADFVRAIPCDSSEMPNEVLDSDGNVVGYSYEREEQAEETMTRSEEGCLLHIEGRRLLAHLERLPAEKRLQITKSPTSLSQTTLASLTLRINQPYWMLHQGNCEHFVVVDEIRLAHPHDPLSGYPLTVHVTPALGYVCKACAKVPAVLTVVGDIRLGESPCLLCMPCWRNMGPPREEDAEQVMVVPLVRHRNVWEDSVGV